MSGSLACACKPRSVLVLERNVNHSAFNGYHATHSDYSRVGCTKCGGTWRTKAVYVDRTPSGSYDMLDRLVAEHARSNKKCARCKQALLQPSKRLPGYGECCALCVVDVERRQKGRF